MKKKVKGNNSSLKKFKNDFSLSKEYQISFNYIKNSKNFIYSAIIIFLIFVALGLFFQDLVSSIFKSLFGVDLNLQILNFIQELLKKTQGMNQKELIGFIFMNNLQSSFMSLILGSIFAIIPLFSSITNGYLLGYVFSASVKVDGIISIWKLLPHGIFELPAVFISLGLGFRLGTYVLNKEKEPFFYHLLSCLKVFLLIIIPLLILAALIEGSLIVFLG